MKSLLINVASFFAGIILWLVSFFKEIPKLEYPSVELVELDRQWIEKTTMNVESLGGHGWTGRGEVLED